MCHEKCTGTDVTLFRESIICLRPGDRGSGPAYRQFTSASRGNRRGGESDRSSLLFPFRRPKEGWTMETRLVDWKAAWEGGRLSASYRWPMDKTRCLRETISFLVWPRHRVSLRFCLSRPFGFLNGAPVSSAMIRL